MTGPRGKQGERGQRGSTGPKGEPGRESMMDTILGRVSRSAVVLLVLPTIFFLATEGLRSYEKLLDSSANNLIRITELSGSIAELGARIARLESIIDKKLQLGGFPSAGPLAMLLGTNELTHHEGEKHAADITVPADPFILRLGAVQQPR